jgi:F-type H+-transporting ATPase subunit gamma
VGRKGFLYFKEKGYNIKKFFQLKEEKVHEQTREVAECIKEIFLKERMSSYMIYNKFESVFRQRVVQEPLLPVPPAARRKYVTDHIYEPSVEVMDRFLHHYLYVQLLHAAFESFVSEHAARMIAMDAATSNAAQMIEELTLEFNKARQAAITKEITEITATKEAMVSGG